MILYSAMFQCLLRFHTEQKKDHFICWYLLPSQCLLLAGQAPASSHLSLTPLVAAYKTHSSKRPAPVTDTFFASQGCPVMRASTVPVTLQGKTTFGINKRWFHWKIDDLMKKARPNRCPQVPMKRLMNYHACGQTGKTIINFEENFGHIHIEWCSSW